MPKLAKKNASKFKLLQPSPPFLWHIGDIVEMKTQEIGYRGAWFRVEIKQVRHSKHGKLYSTVVYKDYPDESEEEIIAIDFEPLTKENTFMIRPLPPPAVKESTYDETKELNSMHLVFRDVWETGDLVDWWYHNCWWSSEVISVLVDGRFELQCPSPPLGEGGVYIAKESDMRASLNWSPEEQWTAPPSRVPGMKQCARLVGPVLCQHVVPVRFLEPEEQIKEHVKMSRSVDKIQMSREKPSKYLMNKKGSFMLTTKHKLQCDKQPQGKLLKSSRNLENEFKDDAQDIFNGEVYPIACLDESLGDGDQVEHVYSEEEICEKQRALTAVQDQHSLSDKVLQEQLKMAKVVGPSSHPLEIDPVSGSAPGKTSTLKSNRPRGRPRKTFKTEVTYGQPVHHDLNNLKNVSKPRVKEKVITDEALEASRDEIPRNSTMTGNKGDPGHRTALLYGVPGEDIQQPKQRRKISLEHIKVGVEQAPPEMEVLFDVGIENVQQSFIDENKRQQLEENVIKEARCVQNRGRGRPRKSSDFQQERKGFKIGDKLFEQKAGMRKEVENESCKNSKGNKKRRLELKIVPDVNSEELSVDWKRKAISEVTTSIYSPAITKGFHFHKIQSENQQVHTRDAKFQTCGKQPKVHQDDPRQLGPSKDESEERGTMGRNTKTKVLKDIPKSETLSGQDLMTKRTKKSAVYGLSLLGNSKLQEPSATSCRPGITSDSEAGLLQEGEFDTENRLKASPDIRSGRSECKSTNPIHDAVLECDLEDLDKPVNSKDVPTSVCGSLNSLSEGIYLSSGVLRENDLNDDISDVGLETDADSCSVKLGCAKEKPLEVCVQDPPHCRGLIMKPNPVDRLVKFSSLRKLVDKPVIKYKSVLGRKLVSIARRELWMKGK